MADEIKYRVNFIRGRNGYQGDEFSALDEALDHASWLDRRLCKSIIVLRIGADGASVIMNQAAVDAWAEENNHASLPHNLITNIRPRTR